MVLIHIISRRKQIMRLVLTLVSVLLILSGCAAPTGPSGKEPSISDAGPYPSDSRQIMLQFLRTKLKDPSSAQVDMVGNTKFMTVKHSMLGPGGYGWGICADVNAKNSFGAFTGFRKWFVLWREGRIVLSYGDLGDNMFDRGLADGACNYVTQ
jgi:hypothetical protein